MRVMAVLGLIWLASCGADGAPQTPTRNAQLPLSGGALDAGTDLRAEARR